MTSNSDRLVLASRGSRLALRQAEIVSEALAAAHPGIEVEIITVKTTGDVDRRPLGEIGGRGLFVAEVERAVLDGDADLAVHSAKDLTAELAPGCVIACVPARAAVEDVVLGGAGDSGEARLSSLAPGAQVGTSSMRRRALLAEARPDLEVVDLRGNLDTRVRKVEDGVVDAAILAAAGLQRLPDLDASFGVLDAERWVPAPAQGALAIEVLAERDDLLKILAPLNDVTAMAEVRCERAFSRTLEGGCSVPLGCSARDRGGQLYVNGYLADPTGTTTFRDRISGGLAEAEAIGVELAQAILSSGGDEILEDMRAMG